MTDVFALEKLNIARQAIAEAKTLPDIKQLLDTFSMMAEYAKRQRFELEIQNDIAECRIWTRRKLGAMLKKMPKNTGAQGHIQEHLSGGSRPEPPVDNPPTLDDLGISKAESSRVQAEVEIPEKVVTEYMEEARDRREEITTVGLERKAKALVSDKPTYDGDEWHTPTKYIKAAREVMGDIELDPATCATAQEKVQAKHFLTKEDDALLHPWFGRVWLNPPYSMPKIERFVDKLLSEFEGGNVIEAIMLVNNSSDTKWFHKLLSRFPACFTSGRVKFWHPAHKSFAARQGQTLFYLGPEWKAEIFLSVFSRFGIVVGRL